MESHHYVHQCTCGTRLPIIIVCILNEYNISNPHNMINNLIFTAMYCIFEGTKTQPCMIQRI